MVACLATAAIGGIWVSAAADFGPDGVLERFVIPIYHLHVGPCRPADVSVGSSKYSQSFSLLWMQSCRWFFPMSWYNYFISPSYNSKLHHHTPKVSALLQKLSSKGLQPTKVVIIHAVPQATENTEWNNDWINWEAFVTEGRTADLGRTSSGDINWCRLSFDAPLWILFSSGTTGRPKYDSAILSEDM